MEVTTQTPVVQVLECMRSNASPKIEISNLRLETTEAGQQRVLEARYYSQRDRAGFKAMLHLTAPEDLAGTRYLLIESDPDDTLHVYLPALDKVRKLNGAAPEASIGDTALRFADLRLVGQALKASSVSLEGNAHIAGREADVLRLTPAIADSPFRRARVTVDRKTCVILKAEFDRPDGVARRYEVDPASLMQSGKHHYASVASLEDLHSEDRVRIILRGVKTDVSLSARLFDPKHFHRKHP